MIPTLISIECLPSQSVFEFHCGIDRLYLSWLFFESRRTSTALALQNLYSKVDCDMGNSLYRAVLGLQMIVSDCIGLFGWIFADFGSEFLVRDASGEDPKEFFIGFISQVVGYEIKEKK